MVARFKTMDATELFINNDYDYPLLYLRPYQDYKQEVLNLKYHQNILDINRTSLSMSDSLADYLNELYPLETDWIITWVPLHPLSLFKRKFYLNKIIAKKIARRCSYQALPFLKNTNQIRQGDQSSKADRIKNARNKFKSRRLIKKALSKNIIIFDDVVATGATMKSCTKILKSGGARNIVWLSIAH